MATHCKYHREVPARYRCPSCDIPFCHSCAKPVPYARNGEVCCPVCNGELESLGIGNTIQPFWERLPRIFAYPADPGVLVPLIVLSLLALASFVPIGGNIIYLIISLAILKTGYVVLEDTSRGNVTPSHAITEKLDRGYALPLKQFAVFIVMVFAVGVASAFSAPLGYLTLFAALFAVPASVITLAIDESFLKAIDPGRLYQIIRAIGWPYLLLCLFLLLLSSGSEIAQEFLMPVMPRWLFLVAGTFVGGYFTLIMFHLMGYVVYQYHEPLGLENVKEFVPERGAKAAAPGHPLINEVNILLAEGRVEEAKGRLAGELRRSNDPQLHDRYHKLLLGLGDHEGVALHARGYIPVLFALDKPGKALDMFAAAIGVDPGFTIADPDHTLRIARLAFDTRRYDLSLKALNGFAQRFPRHNGIPAAYLLAAKSLCEHKNECAKAKKILQSLLAQFPQDPLAGEIQSYLGFLERLEGGSPAAAGG